METMNSGTEITGVVKRQETFSSGSLIEALTRSEKISTCTLEDIRKALAYCFIKVGLRTKNLPDGEEKGLLIAHLVQYYGNHTLSEIMLAFDLAVTGTLDCDANCYENFSPLFLSKVMYAYRKWASERVKEYQNTRKELPQLAAPPLSDREIIDSTYECWKSLKRFEYINLSAYEALVRSGDINLTAAEKEALFEEARSQAKSYQLDSEKDFRSFAKKLAVHRYFLRIDLSRTQNPFD